MSSEHFTRRTPTGMEPIMFVSTRRSNWNWTWGDYKMLFKYHNSVTSWDQIKPEEMIQMSVQENYVDVPRGGRPRRGKKQPASRQPSPGFIAGRRYRYRPFRPHGGNNVNQIPRTIYSGESITFRCLAPTSYFAHGTKFVVRWNNKTLQQIPSTGCYQVKL